MNVKNIRIRSQQHASLQKFLDECKLHDVYLIAKTGTYREETLDTSTTRLIITEVRLVLLKQLHILENQIKEEIAE